MNIFGHLVRIVFISYESNSINFDVCYLPFVWTFYVFRYTILAPESLAHLQCYKFWLGTTVGGLLWNRLVFFGISRRCIFHGSSLMASLVRILCVFCVQPRRFAVAASAPVGCWRPLFPLARAALQKQVVIKRMKSMQTYETYMQNIWQQLWTQVVVFCRLVVVFFPVWARATN